MLYSSGANTTFQNYVVPDNCHFTGTYKFDVRCREWFQQSIKRIGLTPIEPIQFFSQANAPFLASNLCQRQSIKQKRQNSNEEFWRPYSVGCLNFKLSTLYTFFGATSFENSQTVMLDPRSEKLVYNSLRSFSNEEQNLTNAAEDLFPTDPIKQAKFIKQLRDYLDMIYKRDKENPKTYSPHNHHKDNDGNNYERPITPGVNSTSYEYYIQRVNNLEVVDLITDYDQIKSFEFATGDQDDMFVTLNPIVIIEKLGPIQRQQPNQQNRTGYDIQDIFLMIDILPKNYLTEWTDKLSSEINYFFLVYGIGSSCLCIIFFLLAGFISYKVGIMIETPLSHMILLLKRLEKEGSQVALDLIDDSIQIPEDQIFLSLDSAILFESFKSMFKMLHLATQDIFLVEDSQSLLCLNYQISFFKQFNNYRVLGICYNNMGNIHFLNKRYVEAMEYYYHAVIYAQYEQGIYNEKPSKILLSNQEQQQNDNQQQNKPIRISQSRNINERSTNSNSNKINNNTTKIGQNSNTRQITEQKDRTISNSGRNESNRIESRIQEITENEQCEIDNNVDAINEIIFDRKMNFSKAFFMKNSQINSSEVATCPLWEEYEIYLLDLLDFNDKLKSISYGRTILLATQLSYCYLQMNDHQKGIFYQKKAIKAYNDAIEVESLMKKQMKQNNRHESNGILGGHLRLEMSDEDEEQKSQHKETNENDQDKIQKEERSIEDNNYNNYINNNVSGKDNLKDIIEQALKNGEEEVSIDNLFRKRYSAVSDHTKRNSSLSRRSKLNEIIFQHDLDHYNKLNEEDIAKKNVVDQNKNTLNNTKFELSGVHPIRNEIVLNLQYDADMIHSPKSPEYVQIEKETLNSEQSVFQRKPRGSKYLQPGLSKHIKHEIASKQAKEVNSSLNKSTQARQRNYSLTKTSARNHYGSTSKKLFNNSFSVQQQNQQNNKGDILYLQNGSKNQNSQQHLTTVQHAQTLATQSGKKNNEFSYLIEQPHKSNTLQVRNYSSTAQQQGRKQSNSINDINKKRGSALYQRIKSSNGSNPQLQKQNIGGGGPSQLFSNNLLTQNGLTLDTSNKILNSHQSLYSNLNNPLYSGQRPSLMKCKDCNVYDDIASISSQQPQMLKKQKIKKKNLVLMSKINKNLEENEGKKISKYQLPCNILLYFVGLQEAKILMYEKQFASAAFLLTEMLENVKYYLPYYRLQCLNLIKEILLQNNIQSIKLKKLIQRFDDTILFKATTIIAVNTAYSDSAKTCQHLIKEVLIRDDDLYSLIIYNNQILKQVMPPTHMKQIRSASEYFDTLLNYISGDANSVDVSSFSSFSEHIQFQEPFSHSNKSIPINTNNSYMNNNNNNNYNNINSSFNRVHTNQTFPVLTENNDLPLIFQKNEFFPLFPEKSRLEYNVLLPQINYFQPTQPIKNQSEQSGNYFNSNRGRGSLYTPNNLGLPEQQKYQFQILEMTPIRESSKEINLFESNILESHRIISPLSKLLIKSAQTIYSRVNLKPQEHQPILRQKSKSLSKNQNNEYHSASMQNTPSPEDQIFQKLTRKRTSTLPNKSQLPTILINDKTISQHNQEQQQLKALQKFNTIIIRKGENRKLTSKFKQMHQFDNLCINSSQSNNDIHLIKSTSEIQNNDPEKFKIQEADENSISAFKQNDKQQQQQIQDEQDEEEEDKNKLSFMLKSHNTLKRSSFGIQEEMKKIKSTLLCQSQCVVQQGQQSPRQDNERISSLIEQDEEMSETSIELPETAHQIWNNQLNRLKSKSNIENELDISERSTQKSREDNESVKNINEDNINLVLHMAVRRALLSFFDENGDRLEMQMILSNNNIINKCKKFIIFVTDQKGIKENKALFMLVRLLYKAQTQLLILQLDPEESLQESNQLNDIFIQDKSVIKLFYTQEKLLQYIRNKREPMKNFGIPVMMEHFQ